MPYRKYISKLMIIFKLEVINYYEILSNSCVFTNFNMVYIQYNQKCSPEILHYMVISYSTNYKLWLIVNNQNKFLQHA